MQQHVISAGAEQHFHANTGSANYLPSPQPPFASPVHGLNPSPASPLPYSAQGSRLTGSQASSHKRQLSMDPQDSMRPPSRTSPRPRSVTPASTPGYRPLDRSLPSRETTAETIADAFVEFILYCNPNFPLDIDTSTLKTSFQNPPTSNGRSFDIYRVFELVRNLHANKNGTWNELALQLGVEAPDISKGESSQKVQQYTVRLKRWMRIHQVIPFFDYLEGKTNSYFTEIPHPSDPYPAAGRAGVLIGDDMAIKSLDPSFKPKRGRRRNSETEQDDDLAPESKSSRYGEIISATPLSAAPRSAHPGGHDPFAVVSAVTPVMAPWSAAPQSSATPSVYRWQSGSEQAPYTPHPMTSLATSMSAHIDAAFDNEPRSAITPSSKKRRKHNPAVSSAWNPSGSGPGAKPRGRPPANRNIQDGPYGTFPADPANDKPAGPSGSAPARPALSVDMPAPRITGHESSSSNLTPVSAQSDGGGRPKRPSLHVPPFGALVRAHSPPAVLLNGERRQSETRSDSDDPSRAMFSKQMPTPQSGQTLPTSLMPTPQSGRDFHTPMMLTPQSGQSIRSRATDDMLHHAGDQKSTGTAIATFENLRRIVASDLLRAKLDGRRERLSGDEARRLADAVLERFVIPKGDPGTAQDDLARLTAASWLGVDGHVNRSRGSTVCHGKRLTVTRFRTDANGYEEPTYDEGKEDIREVFNLSWEVSLGGCKGSFEMKDLTLSDTPLWKVMSKHDLWVQKIMEAHTALEQDGWLDKTRREVREMATSQYSQADNNIDWKAKYEEMVFEVNMAKEIGRNEKEKILQDVISAALDR